jgi:hypothetical protein
MIQVDNLEGDVLMNDWLQFALGAGTILLAIAALTWVIRSTALGYVTAVHQRRGWEREERERKAREKEARR